MPLHLLLFRAALAVALSLGLVSQLPAANGRNQANQAISDAPYYVPASLPSTSVPRRGPESTVPPRPLVGYVDNCEDVARLALMVGWPPELLAHLTRIAWRESTCKSWAFNPRDVSGGSRGILQVNGAHTASTDWNPRGWLQSQNIGITGEDDLFNAELNLRAGLALYRYAEQHYSDGWQPWNATRDK
jgi:hypothetical protein